MHIVMTGASFQPLSSEAALPQAAQLARAGQLDAAEELYRRILAAEPGNEAALTELARLLQNTGRGEEAEAVFRRVVALRPDLPLAHMNLGVALCLGGKLEEGFAALRRHAELTYTASGKKPPHQGRHDDEQFEYLGAREFHLEKGERIAGRAVTRSEQSVADWRNSAPAIAVIDNFLSGAALQGLRDYCLRSLIWRQPYQDGYLGAMPEHGLGSPLLAQIVEDARTAYPEIIGAHPLIQFWAFKYDSHMRGVAVHADAAKINVNFWITPDTANNDPECGGLIVWDKAAPVDWRFAAYNDDVAAARAFLARAGARPVKIPYRCNRAVIFDSALFHETDRIDFREGYLNRRINVTLLFGRK
jgi:tetratricopeptide (TPR) repeat protein